MTLLDTASSQINGLNDVTFTTRDMIYVVSFVISIITGWFIMKGQIKDLQVDITSLKEKQALSKDFLNAEIKDLSGALEKEALAAKMGRSNLRKELTENIEKREQVLHTRVDRLRDESINNYKELKTEITELRKEQHANAEKLLQAIQNNKK